jgi:TonB family protein
MQRQMFERIAVMALAASSLLTANTAYAETGAAGSVTRISISDFESLPSSTDMAATYPSNASARGVEGTALMSCSVSDDGSLSECTVSNETPPGEGFGDAALALAPKFKLKPRTRDGMPIAGRHILIPLRFALPPAEHAKASPVQGPLAAAPPPPISPLPTQLPHCPGPGEPARFYPEHAFLNKIAGKAIIRCRVGDDHRADDCEIISDYPRNERFGLAALGLLTCYRPTVSSAPVGTAVDIPIRFQCAGTCSLSLDR